MSERMDSVESMDDVDHLCEEMDGLTEMTDLDDIPTALIITNIDSNIFEDAHTQEMFEHVFRDLDKDVSFIYLRNFRRARVQFSSSDFAAIARIRYDGVAICGSTIRCFFLKVHQPSTDNTHLQPPQPQRMFLISPPASPPVGWEPIPESEPVINYDLLHAIARLNPGETHEVHPPSGEAPAIVVHLCEDPEGTQPEFKPQIIQTKRPPQMGPR
ncbi:calcipressin-2 [Aplysia californica]|uniref:Calcipressin-2 n=1 Tax=Aplysia californica TaxID=6500 RepID=A0ABM0JBR6_APLCA|nr:calcipressin-2 [Aplysia californica]